MSIPHICPSCGNHISMVHARDCCYGTPEYAHLGWQQADSTGILMMGEFPAEERKANIGQSFPLDRCKTLKEPGWSQESAATAIRRLLDYLNEEPEEDEKDQIASQELSYRSRILCRLSSKCEELRKEAIGFYNVEARAKRTFAVGILEGLIEELNAE